MFTKIATSKAKKTHGDTDSRLYYIWENMKKDVIVLILTDIKIMALEELLYVMNGK